MAGYWKGYWTGVVVAGVMGPVIGHCAFPSHNTNSDIGIRFEDSAKATTLRKDNALPEDTVKKALDEALDEALENYRQGKPSVVVVKLPTAALGPGK